MINDWRTYASILLPGFACYGLESPGIREPWDSYDEACEQLWANKEGLVDDKLKLTTRAH